MAKSTKVTSKTTKPTKTTKVAKTPVKSSTSTSTKLLVPSKTIVAPTLTKVKRMDAFKIGQQVPAGEFLLETATTSTEDVYKGVDDLYNAAFEFKKPFNHPTVGLVFLRFLLTIVPLEQHIIRIAWHSEWRSEKPGGIALLLKDYSDERTIQRMLKLYEPYRERFDRGNAIKKHEVVHRKETADITHISVHMMEWTQTNLDQNFHKDDKESLGRIMFLQALMAIHSSVFDFLWGDCKLTENKLIAPSVKTLDLNAGSAELAAYAAILDKKDADKVKELGPGELGTAGLTKNEKVVSTFVEKHKK